MTNIINQLMLKNKGNGKGYVFTYKGKQYRSATMVDLVESIFNLPAVQYESWHKEIMVEIQKNPVFTDDKAGDLYKNYLTKLLNEAMAAKRATRDEYQQNSLPSAFNADIIACKFKPAADYNDRDKELLEIFAYCEEDELIYSVKDGNYTCIGAALDISNKKSYASYLAGHAVGSHMSSKYACNYEIWNDLYGIADYTTDAFFKYRRSIEEAITQDKKPSELKFAVNSKDTNMQEFLKLPLDKFSDDWDDALHTAICKLAVNDLMPASLFNNDLVQLCYEAKNNMFHRYSIRPAHGKKSNLNTIISLIFEDPSVIDIIAHIEKTPHIISDMADVHAQYKLNPDWQQLLPEQYKTDSECKALHGFIDNFTENEQKVIMAWSYMALHPSTGESIGLLISTGGGTFKTGYYAEMTRYLMSKMYGGTPENIGFLMKNDAWIENIKLREPFGGKGISKAGMVINDECTSKSIEQYKLWSGSTAGVGIDYEYSKVYQEGKQKKIYCPWFFTSNEEIKLADDKGVYDRRLIVIKRMDLHNFVKPYDMKDYHIHIKKEAVHFYNMAKACYEELAVKYGSLTSAANNISEIKQNLNSIFDEEGKLLAYQRIYDELESDPFEDRIMVSIPEFNAKVYSIAEEFELNAKGLKSYIFNTDKTKKLNIKGYPKYINGKTTRVHVLYKLKKRIDVR